MNLNRLKEYMPIKWRIQGFKQQSNGLFANCVCYIDARDAMDRLDEVFGIGGWQRDHKEVKGRMYAGVGIKINDDWRWFWDAGSESNIEKEKGESSDAFKRACVNIGIGRFMYDLPVIKLSGVEKGKAKYPTDKSGQILWSGDDLSDYINANLPQLTKMSLQDIARTVNRPPLNDENFAKVVAWAKKSAENKNKALYWYSLSNDQAKELRAA